MEPYIQIPKTASKPADSDAPSFLTTLPPELRNGVYEVLFKLDGPVLVHNALVYHAREPESNPHMDPEIFCDTVEAFDEMYETEMGGDREFHHEFHQALSFLCSCRQVYNESSGVLYGCNEFVISRALFRHDIDPDDFHEQNLYSQLYYALQWISKLGYQSSLLRKVVIDVDAVCPANCDVSMDGIDMLPLIQFLWYHANSHCTLQFVNTGRMLSVHEDDIDTRHSRSNVAESFNNILFTLVPHDPLRIKLFSRSKSLLEEVNMLPKRADGVVIYRRRDADPPVAHCFAVSDEGHTLCCHDNSQGRARLLQLPQKILNYAMFSKESVKFDMDTRRVHGLSMNIFQSNKDLRRASASSISTSVGDCIELQTSAVENATSFNEFAAFRDLLENNDYGFVFSWSHFIGSVPVLNAYGSQYQAQDQDCCAYCLGSSRHRHQRIDMLCAKQRHWQESLYSHHAVIA